MAHTAPQLLWSRKKRTGTGSGWKGEDCQAMPLAIAVSSSCAGHKRPREHCSSGEFPSGPIQESFGPGRQQAEVNLSAGQPGLPLQQHNSNVLEPSRIKRRLVSGNLRKAEQDRCLAASTAGRQVALASPTASPGRRVGAEQALHCSSMQPQAASSKHIPVPAAPEAELPGTSTPAPPPPLPREVTTAGPTSPAASRADGSTATATAASLASTAVAGRVSTPVKCQHGCCTTLDLAWLAMHAGPQCR